MNPLEWIVTYGCKLGLRMLYRIEDSEMEKIRADGPLILYPNHTSLLEAPMVYTFLKPRKKVTGLSKIENWKNPFLNLVFSLWKIIPIRRGESDMEALRATLGALADGYIIGIAPEGTRSPSGKLQKAQGGVTMLALHSGSPLQPLAHWDDRPLPENRRGSAGSRRFGRPTIHIRVGRAFHLDRRGEKLTKEIRQEMSDEIMYQLAMLLPEDRRGEYADLTKASEKWLVFEDPPFGQTDVSET
jgi:1-acyl-sn-glycerol-3-phosphate acyltransferase